LSIFEHMSTASQSRGWMVVALLTALGGCGKASGPTAGQNLPGSNGTPADIAGTWLPDPNRAEPWPAQLPLTAAARSKLANFNASEHDPATFCMPLGTPRNMLQTDTPLEIAQTPKQVFIVVQPNLANTEVRRIPTDGSPLPEAPEASWYGTSRGRWEGSTLVVETIGLRPDALVSGNGLAHSETLRVVERLSVQNDAAHGKVLVDEIELHDPMAYEQPVKTRRYFVWAPQAQLREGACVEERWIDKLWRDRLAEHAAAARKAGKQK
jgi:hypothetical protein